MYPCFVIVFYITIPQYTEFKLQFCEHENKPRQTVASGRASTDSMYCAMPAGHTKTAVPFGGTAVGSYSVKVGQGDKRAFRQKQELFMKLSGG